MARCGAARAVLFALALNGLLAGARRAEDSPAKASASAAKASAWAEKPPAKSVVWDKMLRCVEPSGAANASSVAYMVVVGPITASDPKYRKWLYPLVALRTALWKRGSRADLVALLALEEGSEADRMTPSEEALLRGADVRWRYVPKPRIRGFHMGHYKLWAWQHTEYARVQVLDADVLPLVNMDALFSLPGLEAAAFVGCPGKDSVLNAGWFSLRPSCDHFKRMTDLLWYRGQRGGHPWDGARGWGMPMPRWLNALDRVMDAGWSFFDSRGNQGHMYAYFRFFARDLSLIFGDRVVRWVAPRPRGAVEDSVSKRKLGSDDDRPTVVATRGDPDDALAGAVWAAFPCPFYHKPAPNLAYYHFTGNKKPWTVYDPSNARYAEWYDALAAAGVDVAAALAGDPSPARIGPAG